MRTKLEKKDLYAEEDLLKHKLPYKEVEEKLVNSLCDIMFRKVGKDFYWAKEHDLEDLHIIELFVLEKNEYDEFVKVAEKIINKQLSCGMSSAKKEVSWFMLGTGLCFYDDSLESTSLEKHKETLRYKISRYEEKNGELKYSDGWEKELKEFCNYIKQDNETV